MDNNHKFAERTNTQVLIAPQADIDTADVTGAVYFSMAEYRRGIVIAQAEGPGAGKILTVTLKQATDAGGTGSKALGTAVTATAVGTESLAAIAEFDVADLDHANGFNFVSATIGTDKGSAVDGSAVLLRDKGRYSE